MAPESVGGSGGIGDAWQRAAAMRGSVYALSNAHRDMRSVRTATWDGWEDAASLRRIGRTRYERYAMKGECGVEP
ncbi:hypothetical protein BWP39_27140 [Paraburkholderia acidicola]|uniref:Uncharacterized protein n=1 Tax=Paraburkholderia acidicola TaxID=1912599 RepID=A0A2A4ER83_9BURK|nr:hypothetical protein BWP39_27140 [Paraburkholderia acidicola]